MIQSRAFKLRFRRRLRLRRRQVEVFGQQAEQQLDRNLFRRLERLVQVRRFVAAWLLLVVLLAGCSVGQLRALNGYYQTLQPAPGGLYAEGQLGAFTNANPVFATSGVDATVSHLIFAGLLTYDSNNALVGDLAKDWSVNDAGTVYTVHLRPGLTWQDGRPLTASDVAFTYQVIQNPDAGSPLNASWQGITVTAVNATTVTFTLPNILSSFPYSLTNGIIPKHILGAAAMGSLRTNIFNTAKPVGAGPFAMQGIEVSGKTVDDRQERIALTPFDNYHGGRPKLGGYVVRSFRSADQMIASFKRQEINAMVGLSSVPPEIAGSNYRAYGMPLTASVMTFFKMNEGVLADVNVRKALVQATDTSAVIKALGYPVIPVNEPLLRGQLAYNPAYAQASFNPGAAQGLLESQGWKVGTDGYRHKAADTLGFKLYYHDDAEYPVVARTLAWQWKQIGVKVDLKPLADADFQTAVAYHSYEALLYGESVGVDPDVYVYWDSTQADIRASNRLNLSEYKSVSADAALEAGRTRLNPALRTVKYQSFLQAWQADVPALGLYQPRFLYITRGPVFGLDEHKLNSETDRLNNVNQWMIRQVQTSPGN